MRASIVSLVNVMLHTGVLTLPQAPYGTVQDMEDLVREAHE